MSATKEHFHNEIEAGMRTFSSPFEKGSTPKRGVISVSETENPPLIPPFTREDEERS